MRNRSDPVGYIEFKVQFVTNIKCRSMTVLCFWELSKSCRIFVKRFDWKYEIQRFVISIFSFRKNTSANDMRVYIYSQIFSTVQRIRIIPVNALFPLIELFRYRHVKLEEKSDPLCINLWNDYPCFTNCILCIVKYCNVRMEQRPLGIVRA